MGNMISLEAISSSLLRGKKLWPVWGLVLEWQEVVRLWIYFESKQI